jgi:hypothetical protein
LFAVHVATSLLAAGPSDYQLPFPTTEKKVSPRRSVSERR